MNGCQCDNCRKFAAHDGQVPQGWLVVLQQGPPSLGLMSMISGSGGAELAGTFCCTRCLAEHAYVQAIAEGNAEGAEPKPRAGLGWPG